MFGVKIFIRPGLMLWKIYRMLVGNFGRSIFAFEHGFLRAEPNNTLDDTHCRDQASGPGQPRRSRLLYLAT